MHKAGIIGDRESIMGFLPLGLTVAYAYTPEEAGEKLSELLEENCAVIYVTEDLYVKMDLARFAEAVTPAIIPIPGVGGGNRAGVNRLKKSGGKGSWCGYLVWRRGCVGKDRAL